MTVRTDHGEPPWTVSLGTVARQWGRIGCLGFGGPPTHILLLRQLCVKRGGWIPAEEFEDAIAACNLLPAPSSTQLAIFCAGRVGGWPGALVGGAGFIIPGLVVMIALAVLCLSSSPPDWVRAAAAVPGGSAGSPTSWLGSRRAPWPGPSSCSRWSAAAASRC